ncbi:hypothetical protein HGH93_27015 [Chitinophaga polysaccharea]|uniref:hypothetical protein n=1 Tax=Chitinophaga TaxID=79328 RepID=UPI001454E704|nr:MULTISPECIES: hypothetical protein [Chitinophaga]NLR61780.1 hypothetical protein [Chitinophaga polysaccharea]NLU92638.1 hypothetical protein [Chitinophaga sp. Ak27]
MKKHLILFLVILLSACSKENKTFSLKTIRLNDYRRANLPVQKLYLKVFENNSMDSLAHTTFYPSDLTLPATFKVYPTLPMNLYRKGYQVQLWGDSTGYIGTCKVNMDEYKIIFPIDMEVKNDSLSVSMMGSWQ